MLRPAISIVVFILFLATASAQTPKAINNILRDQQQWKNNQLPANSVQRNFGGTNYAAAAWMEAQKVNKRRMQAIQLPQTAAFQKSKPVGETGSQAFTFTAVPMKTSFMQWLSSYLPAKYMP